MKRANALFGTHVTSTFSTTSLFVASPEMVERWYSKRDSLGDINTFLELINYVFRDQDDVPMYTSHHWAYDNEKLTQLFTEAGFRTVEPWDFDPTIANPKRQWGSVYVIATK